MAEERGSLHVMDGERAMAASVHLYGAIRFMCKGGRGPKLDEWRAAGHENTVVPRAAAGINYNSVEALPVCPLAGRAAMRTWLWKRGS